MTKQVVVLYKGKKPSYPEVDGMEYTYVNNPWHIQGMAFDGLIIDDMTIDKGVVKQVMGSIRMGYISTSPPEGNIQLRVIEE